ncbi:MAG TPA: restriction endonuclease subunit S [Lacunisphaera sp.]|nr:restriction endonuclease subunit S [Lacunisphaera sp.]
MSVQMPLLDRAVASSARTPTVQAIGAEQFNVRKFVDSFGAMAAAEGGPARLRELAIELAVQGLLLDRVDRSSWKRVLLSDVVADFQNGIAKRRSDAGKRIPVLRLADIERGNRIRNEGLREIALTVAEQEKYRVRRGDILVIRVNGSADLVGRFVPCEVERDWAYSDHLIRVRPRADLVDTGFVCALARSAASRAHVVANTVTTAGQRTINQVGLGSLPLLLPPLAEQKRIVARVDQLMALIDDLEAKQTKKRDLSTRFTKASLEALTTADSPEAFDTAWQRLLEHWDCVSGNSDLVAELRALCLWLALSGRLEPTKVDDIEWRDTTLGDLAEIVTSGSRGWKEFYAAEGALFIRSQDIKTDALDLTTPAFVDLPEGAEGKRTRVQRDDLLVTITGANVGKAARVTRALPEAYVSQHVALIRLRDPRQAPWVHTWLVSPRNGRATLTATSYGDKPGLNLDNVRSVPIRIPTLVVQARIIARVQHLMRLCDDLGAALCRAEDRASKLIEAVVQEMVG